MINILTLKITEKYSAEYINKLYRGIKENYSGEFNLYCYTENFKDLLPEIKIIPLVNTEQYKLQWHKVAFHCLGFAGIVEGEKCIIMDIDQIIINNLDDLFNYDLPRNSIGLFERWWSNRQNLCSINGGFQMFYSGETDYLWKEFSKNYEYYQEKYINEHKCDGPVNGEQNFIEEFSKKIEYLPKKWVGKYQNDKEYMKFIEGNWARKVDNSDPFYFMNEFNDNIKIIHFSDSKNMIEDYNNSWVKKYWK